MRSLRARILVGIAAPAILILLVSCVAVYAWVRAQALGNLDRSLEVRAAAMAALVDLDGGVWDVEFDREDLPVVELFGSLSAYEVRVVSNGGLLAERRLHEEGVLFDPAIPPIAAADLVGLPSDRPLELSGEVRTVEIAGRALRAWTGVYLVRAHAGEPGEGAREPVGAGPGPSVPVVRIAVAQDLGPIVADLRALLGAQIAVGVALSGLALLAGWVLSRRIVAPIQAIATRAAAVATPSAEPPLPLAGTGDEIDRLADALNQSYLRLHAAYALQGRFTADASHELRTPLAVLRSQVEVALRQPRSREDHEAVLRDVLAGTVRAQAVVEGLLVLARADAGDPELAPVDLAALAAELVDEVEDGPAVRVEGATSAWVSGDVIQLELVIRNLLSNAARHTPPSGEVVVRVETGAETILEVRDTGEGIPADALPHVFERFYRADDARTRDRGGAGLGLSIVKAVVTRHGGTVEAESTPGRGAVLRVRLPGAAARPTRRRTG